MPEIYIRTTERLSVTVMKVQNYKGELQTKYQRLGFEPPRYESVFDEKEKLWYATVIVDASDPFRLAPHIGRKTKVEAEQYAAQIIMLGI